MARKLMTTDPSPVLVSEWLFECNTVESVLNRHAADVDKGYTDYEAIRRMLPAELHDGGKQKWEARRLSDTVLRRGLERAVRDIQTLELLQGV